ncbi:MAG: hypothetical protein AB7U79_05615 [Candidatus Izemoplasmatales bacterium]
MKKGLLIIIGFYLLLALLILLIPKNKEDEITMLSIQEEKSLILFPSETLKFDLFTSKSDTFLFSNDEVSESYLSSLDTTYQVDIQFSEVSDTVTEFYDESYYHLVIEVSFDEIWIDDITIPFEHLYLEIHYQNGKFIKIPYGNLMIHFKSELESSSLSFTNIYAIKKSLLEDQIAGMIIHLYTMNAQIEILDIRLDLVASTIDRLHIVEVKDLRYQNEDELVGNELNSYNDSSIIVNPNEDLVLYLPIINQSNLLLRRFPMIVTYRINETVESMIIDDFIYKSLPSGNLKEIENDIKITRYYY